MPKTTVGDLTIAWDEAGAGDPVVMINGLGADRTGWNQQIPAFAREFRVITFDNRDVGQTGPSARDYDMRQCADDTVGLMDALGIERAHIVGASMGGTIAQEIAIAYPERVRSATLICTWPVTDPWLAELFRSWEAHFAAYGPVAWARLSWVWVFTHRYYEDPNRIAALLANVEQAPNPQTTAMYRRQSQAAMGHDSTDRLGSITCLTHVICGAEDIFTPLRYSQALVDAIPGATLSVIPEAGHGMFWEATEHFNEVVLQFLREH